MLRSNVLFAVCIALVPLVSIFFLFEASLGTDWVSLWRDDVWRDSVALTVYVVTVSTFGSLVVGTWLARATVRLDWRWMSRVLRVPMFVPHIAAAYLFWLLFSGAFPTAGIRANEPNYLIVILTYMWKEIPFVYLMMLGTYEQINRGYMDMAKTLQLDTIQQFRHAELPFLIKPLLDCFWILVAFMTFAVEIPALLGVTYPKMLGVLAYERLSTGLYLTETEPYAVAFLWTLLLAIGVMTSYRATARLRRRIERGVKR